MNGRRGALIEGDLAHAPIPERLPRSFCRWVNLTGHRDVSQENARPHYDIAGGNIMRSVILATAILLSGAALRDSLGQ